MGRKFLLFLKSVLIRIVKKGRVNVMFIDYKQFTNDTHSLVRFVKCTVLSKIGVLLGLPIYDQGKRSTSVTPPILPTY